MTGDAHFDEWLTAVKANSIIDTDLYGQVLYWLSKSQSVNEATLSNLVRIYNFNGTEISIDEKISQLFLGLLITDFRVRGYLIPVDDKNNEYSVDDARIKTSVNSFKNPNLDLDALNNEPYEFGSARHLELKMLYYPKDEKSKMVPVGGYDRKGNQSARVPY